MKRLAEMIDLTGQYEEISMMELRSRPGEIMVAVEMGKLFLIKRNEKMIAVLHRVPRIENGIGHGDCVSMDFHPDGSCSWKP